MRDFRPPALIRGPHLQSILGRTALRRRAVRERAAPMLAVSRQELADCGNGISVPRDPGDSCNFAACPPTCANDQFECPDGTMLNRSRVLLCEFPPCPGD